MAKRLFTAQELKKIEQTVRESEAVSGGEIVPVFTRQSSFYEIALWRGGFILAVISGLILVLLYSVTDWLLFLPPSLWLLTVLTCGLMGAALVQAIPFLKKSLIGKELMLTRALDQAKNMFYDYRVADTEQRTGILLFISFFEKQAVILADVGIAELVAEEQWKKIIQSLTEGLKRGETTESICQSIAACGKLLEESGIQRAETDGNELSDQVRFSE